MINFYTFFVLKYFYCFVILKRADERKTFVYYVNYLDENRCNEKHEKLGKEDKGYGGDAPHKSAHTPPERAGDTFEFTVQMQKIIYEMGYRKKKYSDLN